MVHVPDVVATAAWYATLGFDIVRTAEDDGETVWALLTFGDSEVMLDSGGVASTADRREVDLYIHVDDVEAARKRIGAGVDIVEELHGTFYGMREFIIRDCNRFWITFGQPIA
jgi:uncharacterized glyoxalase superfamily protein PhnB